MLRLAAKYTNGMRGYHHCPFCNDRGQLSMHLGDEVVYLGSAEIHVTVADTTYVAASRGKTFIGDNELLLRLQELGSEPISVVDAYHAGRHFMVYVAPSTLMPVGAVIMYDAQAGGAAGG